MPEHRFYLGHNMLVVHPANLSASFGMPADAVMNQLSTSPSFRQEILDKIHSRS
jgi:hypothetical protein